MESISVDGQHKLEFNEKTHRYKLDGKSVKGVTSILKEGYPEGEALIRWRIKQGIEEYETKKKAQEAADIGSFVHDIANAVEANDNVRASELFLKVEAHKDKAQINTCLDKFYAWKEKNPSEPHSAEQIIASIKYNYAGKYDRVANRNGILVLQDFKTSSGIYINQYLQLAGYAIALKEWCGLDVGGFEIIRFGKKDGSFETRLITDVSLLNDITAQWLRCLGTSEFRGKYE